MNSLEWCEYSHNKGMTYLVLIYRLVTIDSSFYLFDYIKKIAGVIKAVMHAIYAMDPHIPHWSIQRVKVVKDICILEKLTGWEDW